MEFIISDIAMKQLKEQLKEKTIRIKTKIKT